MKKLMLCLLLAQWAVLAFAREEEEAVAPDISLADLAGASDLVALAQVRDTDYEYTREFPSGGTAFLRVLIPYKLDRPMEDMIEIYEEGLHEHECYFDSPSVLEEGRRYLVFLRTHPDFPEQYQGLDPGCALEVFVAIDNRYALKYPPSGIELSDDLTLHATAMEFRDRYVVVTDDDIEVAERNQLLASGMLSRVEGGYKFTHGVDLGTVRQLMGPDALTIDRSLKKKVRSEK